MPAFLPSWRWTLICGGAVKKYSGDGREVCNDRTKAGTNEYKRRRHEMWRRQKGLCCLCGEYIIEGQETFEHTDGRGSGGSRRDDRIVDDDGSWMNGAAHQKCNSTKGSRRITGSKDLSWNAE